MSAPRRGGPYRCPRCLAPAPKEGLDWACPPGCGTPERRRYGFRNVVDLPDMGAVRCGGACQRERTEAFIPGCAHPWPQPMNLGGHGLSHAVLLRLDPGRRPGDWSPDDRAAVTALVSALMEPPLAAVPRDLPTWLRWRRALPGEGWVALNAGLPLLLGRPPGQAEGWGSRLALHAWPAEPQPDPDCPGRPPLARRLMLADAVVALMPAALLLEDRLDRAEGSLLALAADMEAAAAEKRWWQRPAPRPVLILCLTGADRLLDRFGLDPRTLRSHLATVELVRRWLDHQAGFAALAGHRQIRAAFAEAVLRCMVTSAPGAAPPALAPVEGPPELADWRAWAGKALETAAAARQPEPEAVP